jgi:hypothetical protein
MSTESAERRAVRQGLDELKTKLTAFANRAFAEAKRIPAISRSPGSNRFGTDFAAIANLMLDNWDSVFRPRLDPVVRSYLHELRDVRNRWAHEVPFSKEEANRALDTMRLVAAAVGAKQEPPAPARFNALGDAKGASSLVPSASRTWTPEDLHNRFVEAANSRRPVVGSYSWVYGRLFGTVPKPWSQGHGEKVVSIAKQTPDMQVNSLGMTALDTFVVSLRSGRPSPGHWTRRMPKYTRESWDKAFRGAVVLHGDMKAPWE